MARVLYISYDGISEPLGQSQIIPYLKKLSHDNDIQLITYEKKSDIKKMFNEPKAPQPIAIVRKLKVEERSSEVELM